MVDRKTRVSELNKIHPLGAMDHRVLTDEHGKNTQIENLPGRERRRLASKAKRVARKYHRILKKLTQSGAKFPADRVLREFAVEYTHRYAASGIYTQPTSFNYFEPFLHIRLIDNAAPYTDIDEEFNHLFSATDFFDYITSSDNDGFDAFSLLQLPQDQIYHFSTNGSVTDTSFTNGRAREFVVAGFSMIRRGHSIHWYLIGGEEFGPAEWGEMCVNQLKVEVNNLDPRKKIFLSEYVNRSGDRVGEPVPLEDTEYHHRIIVAGEFDIKAKKHLSRCFLAEYKNSFDVTCDDPEIFASLVGEENRDAFIEKMEFRFKQADVLWSLAEGLFQLPRYFESRLALNRRKDKSRKRIPQKKGGKGTNSDYVVIPSLDTNCELPTSTITLLKLPHYQIETEGHWRKLDRSEVGTDMHGNQVIGKTWVASSSKWKDASSEDNTIFIKDSLSSARVKISDYISAAQQISEDFAKKSSSSDSNEGEVYVMRCPAMKEQIYKVGFTVGCSVERASQLSSATGVPQAFVVIHAWPHKEAKKLETEVHMMLSPYRVADNREFFNADYNVIKKIVESAVKRSSR